MARPSLVEPMQNWTMRSVDLSSSSSKLPKCDTLPPNLRDDG
jgi:hypothetical protein